jgi:hypothetical protein
MDGSRPNDLKSNNIISIDKVHEEGIVPYSSNMRFSSLKDLSGATSPFSSTPKPQTPASRGNVKLFNDLHASIKYDDRSFGVVPIPTKESISQIKIDVELNNTSNIKTNSNSNLPLSNNPPLYLSTAFTGESHSLNENGYCNCILISR